MKRAKLDFRQRCVSVLKVSTADKLKQRQTSLGDEIQFSVIELNRIEIVLLTICAIHIILLSACRMDYEHRAGNKVAKKKCV